MAQVGKSKYIGLLVFILILLIGGKISYHTYQEIKLNKEKRRLLHIVMEKEYVSLNEAIKYYMVFTLSSLGYHI